MTDGGTENSVFYYKIKHNDCPLYLTELLPNVRSSGYITVELNVSRHLSFPLVPIIGTN